MTCCNAAACELLLKACAAVYKMFRTASNRRRSTDCTFYHCSPDSGELRVLFHDELTAKRLFKNLLELP